MFPNVNGAAVKAAGASDVDRAMVRSWLLCGSTVFVANSALGADSGVGTIVAATVREVNLEASGTAAPAIRMLAKTRKSTPGDLLAPHCLTERKSDFIRGTSMIP